MDDRPLRVHAACLFLIVLSLGCISYLQENFFVEVRDARRQDCPARTSADADPVAVWRVPPRYPLAAWEEYVQGRVLLEFELNDEGRIDELRIVAEVPEGYFGEASIEAMRQWEYCPIKEGEPSYEGPYRIVIPYRLSRRPDEIPLVPGDLDIQTAQ